MRFFLIIFLFPFTLTAFEKGVVAAHPEAVREGLAILRGGGNAIDAAVAVQMVLSVVEPQSSGLGGGAMLLYYRKRDGQIVFYDGRERAPLLATSDYFYEDGEPLSKQMVALSGKAVGVPGVLRLLEKAHQEEGRLPWDRLFGKAITLARDGFLVSPRFERILRSHKGVELVFSEGKNPKEVRNPDLAKTLSEIAEKGADHFYTGPLTAKIVEKVRHTLLFPGLLTQDDFASYAVVKREPIIFDYHGYTLVGAPPPSAGGIVLGQILGMLSTKDLTDPVEKISLFAKASQIAFANRNHYIGDPDYTQIPQLLDIQYVNSLLDSPIENGTPPMQDAGTTHFCIVDAEGNAVAMTSSLGKGYGSKLCVEGVFLNNNLASFCQSGNANTIAGGKRPLSSMSPTFVFKGNELLIAIGSAGGPAIMDYVAQALLETLNNNTPLPEAINAPHVAYDETLYLEKETPLHTLLKPLKKKGFHIEEKALTSGTHALYRTATGWQGAADSRREGVALFD